MAIRIKVSSTVQFTVKGVINDERGIAQPFEFRLTCWRLSTDEYEAATQDADGKKLVDFMAPLVQSWAGVKDEEGKDIPYTEDALRELFKIPGIAQLAFATYAVEAGAKAKN